MIPKKDIFVNAKPEDFEPLPCGAKVLDWHHYDNHYDVRFNLPPGGGLVTLVSYNPDGTRLFQWRPGADLKRKPALAVGDRRLTSGGNEVTVIAFDPDGNPIVKGFFGGLYSVPARKLFPVPAPAPAEPKVRKEMFSVVCSDSTVTSCSSPSQAERWLTNWGGAIGIIKITTESDKGTGKTRLVSVEVI